MIEEAAGTRLYESKKEAAQKTIEKKDAKLREIDTVNILINDHVNILNSQEFFVRLVNLLQNYSYLNETNVFFCVFICHTLTYVNPHLLLNHLIEYNQTYT